MAQVSHAHRRIGAAARRALKMMVPLKLRQWMKSCKRKIQHAAMPLRRISDFGSLRRLRPIDSDFGWSRGLCVDRYYIEKFLSANAESIKGRVLEFQTNIYAVKFGADRVAQSDVLDIIQDNPAATIVADLAEADHLPAEMFDCIICTQVLLLIYDLRNAIRTLYRILKPGGVVLCTVPGIAHKVVSFAQPVSGDYWRFTTLSIKRLFAECFDEKNIHECSYGNVLTAVGLLHGLAAEEFAAAELEYNDPDYQVTIAVKAVKA
jgi:SAM-dependent methyltransferase